MFACDFFEPKFNVQTQARSIKPRCTLCSAGQICTLIGRQLDVNFSEYVVEILYHGQRVASHAKLHGNDRHYSTVTAHMPKGHREMSEWTPERIVSCAASIGERTARLINALIEPSVQYVPD